MDKRKAEALEQLRCILDDSLDPVINDVTQEGAGDDAHLIVTLDNDTSYQLVRVDVTYLGVDELDHESG